MNSRTRKATPDKTGVNADAALHGLFRTTLAGPGRSLLDAFAHLDRSPKVEQVLRHPKHDLLSARVSLNAEEGQGHWELTRIRNDLYIILANFSYKNPRLEIVPGDGLPQFNFKLASGMVYEVGVPGRLRFNHPALHVWRQSEGVEMQEWTGPRAQEKSVSISVRPEFLIEQFLGSDREVPQHLAAFVLPSARRTDFCQFPLTAQMIDIVAKLLDNPYDGPLALVYTEALAVELLCLALGGFAASTSGPSEKYSDRELQSLSKARELLLNQFSPMPTIKKIARSVGLSEKTLTRGFKTVYGETVFDFSLRCRMQHALAGLRDRRWSVDQASAAVGYAHPTTFTAAFRRHFGIRPMDVKRLKDP